MFHFETGLKFSLKKLNSTTKINHKERISQNFHFYHYFFFCRFFLFWVDQVLPGNCHNISFIVLINIYTQVLKVYIISYWHLLYKNKECWKLLLNINWPRTTVKNCLLKVKMSKLSGELCFYIFLHLRRWKLLALKSMLALMLFFVCFCVSVRLRECWCLP